MAEPMSPEIMAMVLAFFRVGGLMLVAPLFSSRSVPPMVRAGIAVLFTLLVLPAVGSVPETARVGPAAMVAQLVIGLGVGLGAAVMLAGVELAGEVLSVQTGLSGATALDPLTGQGTVVLGHLLSLMVLVLLLVSGGHLVMLEALAASFRLIPASASLDLGAGAWELLRMGGLLFTYGLQFAAPIVAAISVGYVALGVLARASPQLNMLAVAFPLQIGLGLLVLAGVLPLTVTPFAEWPRHIEVLVERFLAALRMS